MKSRLFVAWLFLCLSLLVKAQDVQPPVITFIDPAPGAVPSLTSIRIDFSEAVMNVNATDLLIDGFPADTLSGEGNSWTFNFFEPTGSNGIVRISWAADHGITDLAANPFDSATSEWTYTVRDRTPPTIRETIPAQGRVTNFTQLIIRFSEPVMGVEAQDLILSGSSGSRPATGVSGGGDTYTFTFPHPRPEGGRVFASWAVNPTNSEPAHGITDLSSNAFNSIDLGAFFEFEAVDVQGPRMLELRPHGFLFPFSEVQATFSEGVTNVNATDLLLNGQPALSVTNFTNTTYVFRFAPARRGLATLAWADDHGITDLSEVFNAFVGEPAQVTVMRNYSILPDRSSSNTFVVFKNLFPVGVGTLDGRINNRWVALQNFFTTQRLGQATIKLPPDNATQLRLRWLAVEGDAANRQLARAYGTISTVAGGGNPANPWPMEIVTNITATTNIILTETNVILTTNITITHRVTNGTAVHLSDPCCVVTDQAGNIYLAERSGHAVDKITPDGTIFTFMGQRRAGFDINQDGTNGVSAGEVLLNTPSGLFIVNNTLYVLDAGNNRVRSVDLRDPSLATTVLFIVPDGIGPNARGLYVGLNKQGEPNEALFGVGGTLRSWEGTVTNLAIGFGEIGFVTRDPRDDIVVADPLNNSIYEVSNKGRWGPDTVIAGTGFRFGNLNKGDMDEVDLPGARAVAYLPLGGFLIGLDDATLGGRVVYVDNEEIASTFIFGEPGAHEGDGKWFRKGGSRKKKISNVESIAIAPNGDIILIEGGIVRQVKFLRLR